MSDGRLELHFGVLADPLQLQLASQGWAGSG